MKPSTTETKRFAAMVSVLGCCAAHLSACAPEASAPRQRPTDSMGAAGTGTGTGGVVGAETPLACQVRPSLSPVRRLTRAEYNTTVRDLLGDATRPADAFPAEVGSTEFGNDARALDFSRLLMEHYFTAATDLAGAVTSDASRFTALLKCEPAQAGERACAERFVDQFGLKAYRRPLAADEKSRLLAVYDAARGEADFRIAVGSVIRTVLQAPQFLYRVEVGAPVAADAGLAKLGSYEMASRLSYLLWGTMPDDALFSVAANGQLETKAQVLAQATRLVADPRAHDLVSHFHDLAFKLGGIRSLTKDAQVFTAWRPGTGILLAQETALFLDHAVWQGSGGLTEMLTGSYTFRNSDLARFYGVPGPTGSAFERVELDPAHASGFLTQAGPLTLLGAGTQTNPVRRGYFVRNDVLCDPPPSPPANLMVVPPKPEPGQTTRESFAQHSKDGTCVGCHRLMDPLGFAFEGFDAIGLPRTTEQGKPVDTSGELYGTSADGHFQNAPELLARVATTEQARGCYVKHWYEFGYGRGITPEDDCALATLDSSFAAAGLKVQDLLLALTQIDSFQSKAVDP